MLNFAAFPVLLYLAFQAGGGSALVAQLSTSATATNALLLGVPAYMLASMLWAVFQVGREERAKGTWSGARFVYHSPPTVLSALVTADDDGKQLPLGYGDAEPGSLVELRVEIDRSDERVKTQVVWDNGQPFLDWSHVARNTHRRLRLSDDASRKLGLLVQVAPESSESIVRVRLISFELGKGEVGGMKKRNGK